MRKNKNTSIYKLGKLLQSKSFVTRLEVNKLVGSSVATALIHSLIKKGYKIETIRDFDEVHGYKFISYTPPFYLVSRDIEKNHPRLEKIIRALYSLSK